MLPISWRDSARKALADIVRYIAAENPFAARKLKGEIQRAPALLSEHPYLYPEGRVSGTRELVVNPNYIIIYRVRVDCVEIIDVVHARRQYP